MKSCLCRIYDNDMSYTLFFFYLLVKFSILKVFASISIIDRGVLTIEKNSVGIRFFIDIVNEDRVGICQVYSRVKKCCLTDLDVEDCDTMNVIGETVDVVQPRDRKTLEYVFPTLCAHDLVGYCDVALDYRCNKSRDRLNVHIPFDTRLINTGRTHPVLRDYVDIVPCETIDQNPIDNCYPVDCEVKYAGQRSFYDEYINRCIKVPVCIGEMDKERPSVVYVPSENVCKNLDYPLTSQDIYAITTGLGTVTRPLIKDDDDIKVEFKSNCSTISQNLYLLKDLMFGKLCPCDKSDINYEDGCKSAILSIVFCVISICALLIGFMLCVNTTVWVYNQWSRGNIDACLERVRNTFKSTEMRCHTTRKNNEVKNTLLREVMVKDIPLEIRENVVSICERMEKELRTKKRYRDKDIGSQISLLKESARETLVSSSSTETLCSEKDLRR